jgi:hypothetical protein
MTVSLPNPSSRLLRAAVAEQADLVRHRERLTHERALLLGELRQLDEALAAADRRLGMLAELAGQAEGSVAEDGSEAPGKSTARSSAQNATQDDDRPVLRGPAIREAAVRVLLAQPEPIEALHYRKWYELLVGAGFRIAGKDPVAVFLTQLSRSPLVRKTSAPGVYEVDRQAPHRIRHRLERLQAELREVMVAAPGQVAAASPIELSAVRARRHELDLAISQQERALEEAMHVLHGDRGDTVRPGAVQTG